MDIKTLYDTTTLTLQQIADSLGISYAKVFKYVKRNYTPDVRRARKAGSYRRSKLGDNNPMYGVKGNAHHNFRGAVSDGRGYLMVLRPSWYTGRVSSKHVFEHHVVVCEHLGLTAIPRGWCVHHVDRNPQNNGFENLVLLTVSDHAKVHHHDALEGATTISKESTLKWVEAHGTPWRDDIV